MGCNKAERAGSMVLGQDKDESVIKKMTLNVTV